jgi:hypothetical protein
MNGEWHRNLEERSLEVVWNGMENWKNWKIEKVEQKNESK